MSDTNAVQLIYVPEIVYGVTPVNATTWETMRFTGETLQPSYQYAASQEIRSDRNQRAQKQVSASAGGSINYELSAVSLDVFMQAVLGGTWTADVLKVGTIKRSFSFQKFFSDLATGNKYELMKGGRIGSLSLALQYGSIATGTLEVMGSGWSDAATTAVGSGSVADATDTEVLNGTTDLIEVAVDGVPSTLYFQRMELNFGAQLRAKTAITKLFPFDQGYGSALIQGSGQFYFTDRTIENKVRSGAPVELEFQITDGANSYTINVPKAFITQRDGLGASGLDADIVPTFSFVGGYDSTAGSSVVITRDLA